MDFLFFPKRTDDWKLLDLPLHKAAFLTFTDMSQEQWCSSDEHLAYQNRYAIPVSTIQDDTSRCPRHSHHCLEGGTKKRLLSILYPRWWYIQSLVQGPDDRRPAQPRFQPHPRLILPVPPLLFIPSPVFFTAGRTTWSRWCVVVGCGRLMTACAASTWTSRSTCSRRSPCPSPTPSPWSSTSHGTAQNVKSSQLLRLHPSG